MRISSTILRAAVLLLPIAIVASAHGTAIVIGYSKDKIVIAAESRRGDEGKSYEDDACKVTALSDRFLFTVSGRNDDKTDGVLGWDATEQAKSAFSRMSRLPLEFTPALDTASFWEETLLQNINDHIRPSELANLGPTPMYIDGWFLGLSPMGNIQAAYARIGTIPRTYPVRLYAPPVVDGGVLDTMEYRVQGGDQRLFDEFYKASSARAKAESSKTAELFKTWSSEEVDVREVIRMLELIIQYTDRPKDVGGPIDAVELKRGGTVHWIQRKPICKD
jgi:hypothetical protein